MPRPQDLPSDEFEALVALGRERRFTEVYERMRIRLADHRSEIPRELPFTPPFNKWSAEPARRDVLRAGHGGDGALPDDPVRGARRGVRVLLPRRPGLADPAGRASPGSGGRRAATCTTTSTTAGSARSTRSRRTCWSSAGSSRG